MGQQRFAIKRPDTIVRHNHVTAGDAAVGDHHGDAVENIITDADFIGLRLFAVQMNLQFFHNDLCFF